jgi:membrane associated rhomboid family serine protease
MTLGARKPFTKSVTFAIILANVIVWLLQLFTYPVVDDVFALTPGEALSGRFYQFFTYMFLHATYAETAAGVTIYPGHLVINMFVFAIFGFQLEQSIGTKKFTALYILSGIGSALFYIGVMSWLYGAIGAGLIGASGAVFGVLAAYAFLYPTSWVYMLGLFPMPAAVMLVFLLVEETFFGLMGLDPGVANFGHVGGVLSGLIIMTVWRISSREKKTNFEKFEFVWE